MFFLAGAGAIFAAPGGPMLDEARRLLEANQAGAAAALLERGLLQFAGNADYDYLLGLALSRAGQPGPAQFAFERVLMVAPGHIEARLRLAQIDVERGGARYAKEVLAPLAAQPLDAGQQEQLAQLRARIATAPSGTPLAVHAYILGGIGWDDNVTSGPNQKSLIIPGLGPIPTALGNAARDGDQIGILESGVALSKTLNEDTWLTGGTAIRWGDNRRRDDVQEGFVNLDLGLVRRSGSEFFGVALATQNYRLGNKTYRNSLGARLHWTHPITESWRLTGYGNYIDFDFPDHPIDNAARRVLGVTAESSLAEGSRSLRFGVYGGEEKAKDPSKPHFSFDLLGAQLGAGVRLSDDLALAAGAVYEQHRHTATDALYLIMRRDRQLSLGLSADYRLLRRWHLVPQYSFTHNASNAALNTYTRNAYMLHLRWDFDHE